MDAKKGQYCRHIEKKLPKMPAREHRNTYSTGFIEAYGYDPFNAVRQTTWYEIQTSLRKFGLTDYEIELLMLRVIDGHGAKAVMKKQGWLSLNSLSYHLKKVLKKLRDGKFRL